MLQAAAYVVCAYLTGMRDCEVQAMRRGCLSIARSEDGLVERRRVRSTLYKGRSSIGESARWVRSEERRVGKESVSTCRSRWSPYPSTQKTNQQTTQTTTDRI